jgi:hypothetical protein
VGPATRYLPETATCHFTHGFDVSFPVRGPLVS